MYEITPRSEVFNMSKVDTIVIAVMTSLIVVSVVLFYFSKKERETKEREKKESHYILERDDKGRIVGIIEREIDGVREKNV